jgi:hypothetical protein
MFLAADKLLLLFNILELLAFLINPDLLSTVNFYYSQSLKTILFLLLFAVETDVNYLYLSCTSYSN